MFERVAEINWLWSHSDWNRKTNKGSHWINFSGHIFIRFSVNMWKGLSYQPFMYWAVHMYAAYKCGYPSSTHTRNPFSKLPHTTRQSVELLTVLRQEDISINSFFQPKRFLSRQNKTAETKQSADVWFYLSLLLFTTSSTVEIAANVL